MKKYSDKFYEMLHKNSIKRRRMISLLLVLSTFTASGVVWTLRGKGVTMANNDDDLSNTMFPSLSLGNGYQVLANHTYEPSSGTAAQEYYNDITEKNVDNISKGINITMFDYAVLEPVYVDDGTDENGEKKYKLESWKEVEGKPYINQQTGKIDTTYYGINSQHLAGYDDSGIYFFPYSTNNMDLYVDNNNDGDKDYLSSIVTGVENKNYYSGNYNVGPPKQSGNRGVQGIVKNQLGSDGYPVINNSSVQSLKYLFDDQTQEQNQNGITKQFKWVYKNTNGLLHEQGTHLRYSSDENYAYLNTAHPEQRLINDVMQDVYNFEIQNKTFRIVNDDHHIKDDTNVRGYTYNEPDPEGAADFMIGFFPFDPYNNTKKDPNWDAKESQKQSEDYNHHFGMKMDARFMLPSDGLYKNEPVTFSYSGDDDMWVFIDGVLVLDIGGVHEPAAGMIDFTNGIVWIQDNANVKKNDSAFDWNSNDLVNELKRLTGRSDITLEMLAHKEFPRPEFGFETNGNTSSRWLLKTIDECFNEAGQTWNPSAEHKLDMFYLERGGCYSNLSVDMNLPTTGALAVEKKINGNSGFAYNEYKDVDYRFAIYQSNDGGKTYSTEPVNNGIFTLKAGERKVFVGLETGADIRYKIVELDVNKDVVEKVIVPGDQLIPDGNSGFIAASGIKLNDSGNTDYPIDNKIYEESDLYIKKEWQDSNPNNISEIKYRLYRRSRTINDNHYSEWSSWSPVAYEKRFTQTLSKTDKEKNNEEWTKKIDLPIRCGNIMYEYTAKEIEVPGYTSNPTFDSESKTLTIENVPENSNVSLKVEKKWENTPDLIKEGAVVHLKLMQTHAELTETSNTQVTIRVVDKNGNKIYDPVNVDAKLKGSIEFTVTPPNKLPEPKSVTPETVLHDGNVFAIDNITANQEIVITYDIETADVNLEEVVPPESTPSTTTAETDLIYHQTFEGTESDTMPDGWYVSGTGTGTFMNYKPNSGSTYLNVKGRDSSQNWSGPTYTLDLTKYLPNQEYTYAVYVRGHVENSNTYTINYKLTLACNDSNYHELATLITNDPYSWKKLIGKFTIPSNASSAFIKIETPASTTDTSVGNYSNEIKIDDFVIVKGDYTGESNGIEKLKVNESGEVLLNGTTTLVNGTVTSGSSSSTLDPEDYNVVTKNETQVKYDLVVSTFGTAGAGDWKPFKNWGVNENDAEVAGALLDGTWIDNYGKEHSKNFIVVSGGLKDNTYPDGTAEWFNTPGNLKDRPGKNSYSFCAGITADKLNMEAGHTYKIKAYVSSVAGNQDTFRLAIYQNGAKSGDYYYFPISEGTYSNSTGLIPMLLEGNVTLPENSNPSDFTLHIINTATDNGHPYCINAFVVEETVTTTTWVAKGVRIKNKTTPKVPGTQSEAVCVQEFDLRNTDNWETTISGLQHKYSEGNYYFYYVKETGITLDGEPINLSDFSINYSDPVQSSASGPLTVTNTYVWYKLPETGGSGLTVVYAVGGLLIAAAVVSGYAIKKRERRSE